jgi:hypothetical protein
MADNFNTMTAGLTAPAINASAVTPSDSTDLTDTSRGLYVGVSGDVKVTMAGGAAVTFVGLAAGVIHPIRASRVWSTGTTATSIIAIV